METQDEPQTEPLEENLLVVEPDLYLVEWVADFETTYVIAIVKTKEEAHKVIRDHVQQLPTYINRIIYEIEPRNIGEVRTYL